MTEEQAIKEEQTPAQSAIVTDSISNNQTQKPENVTATETDEERNWKAFRESRKKEREAREAAEKRALEKEKELEALRKAMEAAFVNKTPSEKSYDGYYNQTETEEDTIEKKIEAVLTAREERLQREKEERETREYPKRLLKDLPDFTNICSQENLDYIDYYYPEISRPLQKLQEGYEKWSDIYHAVKKLVPNSNNTKRDEKRIEQNALKPQSPQGRIINTDQKPPSSLREVEERRAANWERMQKTLKGIG
jgi:hypothetical protein